MTPRPYSHARNSSRTLRPRARGITALLAAVVSLALMLSGATSAWTLNVAQLDNGVCGTNLQLGSDKTASSSTTPSFLLWGNGGAASYAMFIDGQPIGTFNSDAFANVCIYTTAPLSQGTHLLTGNELRPNASNVVTPFAFSVDSVAPAAPSTPQLASFSDSGVLGDNLSRGFPGVTLFGSSSEPSLSIQLYGGASGIGGAKADTLGNWSAATSPLANGTYQVTAHASDNAGNKSVASGTLPLRIDATAPSGQLTSPLAGATVSGTLPLNAAASDSVGIWKVDFKVDNVSKLVDTTSPYSYLWNSTAVTNANHTLTALVHDLAGNTTTHTITVTVDNTTPPAPTAPGAPTLDSATAGNGSVTLAWSAPASNGGSAVTGYKVYRGTSAGNGSLLTTLGSVTGYTDNSAANGTTYFYTVSALNTVGEGNKSNERSATPVAPATAPGAPTLDSATAGNGSVTLAWSAPSSNGGSPVTGYKVYRGTSAGNGSLLATIGNLTGYTDNSAANGITYFYTVSAVNSVGEGNKSNERSATPVAPATAPGAPTLDSATAGNGSVTLAWSAPSSNGGSTLTGYKLYRGTSAGNGSLLATLGTLTGYTDNSAANGTTYYYTVSALNSVGEGNKSNERSATPVTVPGAPTLNSATAGNGSVTLAWSAPSSNGGSAVTGYKVFRGTSAGNGSLLTTLGTVTGYTDGSAANGTTYFYTVSALNSVGEGNKSNERSATPVTVPGAPTLNSATAGNGSVTLAWNAPGSNGGSTLTGYKLYRGTSAGNGSLLATIGNLTGYTDNSAVNGTTYFYTVSALNTVGEGNKSNERSATPATVPGAPTLDTATPGNNSVALNWSAPASNGGSGINSYLIYRGTTSNNAILIGAVANVTSATDNTATNGTTYFYTVAAVNAVGEGAKSNERSATPVAPATAPGAPTLDSATAGNGSVTLAWSAPSSNGGSAVTGYKVFRGTSAGNGSLLATIGNLTGYTDNSAANGTTYFYTVSAVNSVGEGNKSNERSATPVAPATAPGAPTLDSATAGNGSVTLAWSAPSSNGGSPLTGYKLYRGTSAGNGTLLATIGTLTGYTDNTALNGTTYFYTVSALNTVGESNKSNERSATPVTVPGAPTLNSATAGNGSVTLAWSAPASNGGSAITGYKVYRGTSAGNGSLLTTLGTVSGYTDTSAANGTTYFYTVAALNTFGEGTKSNERSATPVAPVTAPGAPTLDSATPGNGSVTLAWSAPSSNGGSPLTGYKLYRGTSAGNGSLLTTLGTVSGYTDSSAVNGTTYFYTVSALNSVGEGNKSNERSATPVTVPGAPTLNSATAGNGSVTLAWSAPASNGGSPVTGYKLYRGTSAGNGSLLTTLGTVTGYTDNSAANGTTYFYTVSALNTVGESTESNERSATPEAPLTAPSAPTLNSATAGNGSVTLAWSAPSSNGGSPVTGYKVFRGTSAGNGSLLTTLGTVTGYTDNSAANGTTYFYTVAAVNAVGESTKSNERSATPVAPATAPGAPTLDSATAGNGSVTLAWSAPSSNGGSTLTGYKLYRGTSAGNGTLLATIGTLTGYTDSTALNGTTYYYTVSALNAVGESVQSNERSATPEAPLTAPSAPALDSATAGNGSVTLAWSAPSSNGGSPVTGYKVYRGTSAGNGSLLTTLGTVTGYTDGSAANGTTYFYTVAAVNAVGDSTKSNERSATPVAPATAPGAPTLNSAIAGNNSVTLAWSAPSSNGGSPVTGYRVYRGTSTENGSLLTTLGTVNGYTDNTAVNGTTYFYTVSAVNSVGEGTKSDERSATPAALATIPGAPSLDWTTAGDSRVTLAWSAPASDGGSAISGYRIYRGTTSGGQTLLTTVGTVAGFTDATAANGTTYYYVVSAVNAVGEGLPSNERSAMPATTPGAPTLMSAVPGNSVTLSWNAPASSGGMTITGYRIYRGTTSGDTTFLTSVGAVGTYTDETTDYGTTYYYQVSAVTSMGEGSRSNELSATPLAPPSDTTPPSKPASMKLLMAGTTQAALNWLASTDNAGVSGYRLFRDGALLATVDETHFLDQGLAPGSTHTYFVRALDAAGNQSLASSTITVRAVALSTSSTGTIAGVVYNSAGKMLSNAVVRLTLANGTLKSTKTSNTGVWKVTNLPAQTYPVSISLSGFQSQTLTRTVSSGRTVLAFTTLAAAV